MPVSREPRRKGDKNRFRIKVWFRGKPFSKIFRGSRADAESEEARFRLEIAAAASAKAAPAAAPRFIDFCADTYLPAAELRLRASWLRNQTYTIVTLCEALGEIPVDAITVEHIEDFARARLKAKREPSTINGDLRVLHRILGEAKARGLLAAVPRCAPLPQIESVVEVWSYAELAVLLDAAAKVAPHLVGIIAFLANTGARRGESMALKWEHVDLERGLIKFWPSAEWQPKSGRPREVPISDALRPWLELPRRSAYVFPTVHGRGKGGRRRTWPRAFDAVVTAAGLEGTPHKLRHTFAAHFLSSVPDLTLLAEILGHSDTAVTKLYKHLLPDHLARARNAVQVAAPPAAAEALAMARWRAGRTPARAKPAPRPAPDRSESAVTEAPSPNGAGYRVRTGDIKLGNIASRPKILKLLQQRRMSSAAAEAEASQSGPQTGPDARARK